MPQKDWWVIVGGRRRLGRALAELLATEHNLVLTSARPWEEESRWIKELAESTQIRTCCWDAEDAGLVPLMMADLERLREDGIQPMGASLVAGKFPSGAVGTWSAEALSGLWQTNVTFPLLAAQALAPHLVEGASLQFLLDTCIHRPWAGRIPYCASKAALASAVVGLARALAPRIRVVGHALGTLLPEGGGSTEGLVRGSLLQRLGDPDDLARATRYVRDASYLTGEILTLDGGTRWGAGCT